MDTYTDLGLTENMLYLQIEWCSIIFNIKVGLDGIYPNFRHAYASNPEFRKTLWLKRFMVKVHV